jgi:IMP dehydrogenase/GMP reductase
VPARGSVRMEIHDMLRHLCSSISYGGASSLSELREKFDASPEQFLVKLSASSRAESFQR